MKIDGSTISSAHPFHENILVYDDKGKQYFLSPKDLTAILSEFLFIAEKKRKRTHLYPILPTVELLYEQELYEEIKKENESK